jgi:hypothetical protein
MSGFSEQTCSVLPCGGLRTFVAMNPINANKPNTYAVTQGNGVKIHRFQTDAMYSKVRRRRSNLVCSRFAAANSSWTLSNSFNKLTSFACPRVIGKCMTVPISSLVLMGVSWGFLEGTTYVPLPSKA